MGLDLNAVLYLISIPLFAIGLIILIIQMIRKKKKKNTNYNNCCFSSDVCRWYISAGC